MLAKGGLLTDFPSETNPDRPNFLKRNRIIAGLSEATLVIESAEKGGSLVTADIAFSYDREVFACPGRIHDLYSAGCNQLIRHNKAALLSSVQDLIEALGWQHEDMQRKPQQTELLFNESDSQEIQQVLQILQDQDEVHINQLTKLTGFPVQQLTNILFELEMDGRIRTLPGNMYKRK